MFIYMIYVIFVNKYDADAENILLNLRIHKVVSPGARLVQVEP